MKLTRHFARLPFRRLRFFYLAVSIPLALTVLFGTLRIPLRDDSRNLLFDYYQQIAPRHYDPESPVRIIDIDDESLRRGGQWPWPRNQMAAIVDRLTKAHAAAIGFDFLFAEPDRGDLNHMLRTMPQSRVIGLLEQELSKQETLDDLFARALANRPVVLASVMTNGTEPIELPSTPGFVSAGDDPAKFVTAFPGGVMPLPAFVNAAAGTGSINWLPDHDRTIRRVPLVLTAGGNLVASLAMEMLRVAQGASTYVIKASNASGETGFGKETGVIAIKVGSVIVPTQAAGDVRIRFTRPEPRRYIPAWKLFADASVLPDLDGKLVLVGSSASTLKDIVATPLSPSMPGVEILAQLIEQILSGETLVRPDYAEGLEFAAGLFLSLAFVLALPRISALAAALVGGVAAVAIAGGSWYAFVERGLLFDPLFPSLWPGAVFLAGVYALYAIKRQQEGEVRQAFGRFVSPAVVARLAERPDQLVLGGVHRELTLMFCDLRSFTTLSEGLSAQDLTHFLNDFLTPMTDIILDHSGTIDKYMGDAIMAFWNAPLDDPDHARNSTHSALLMRMRLQELNARWQTETTYGKKLPIVKFGIGLNTGEASVGNLGSIRRFDYSAIGDEVNVTSRLESATKFFGVDIVASQATRDGAPEFAWVQIDDVVLKGKSKPVAVFALAGGSGYATSAEFRAFHDVHDAMRKAAAHGDYVRAAYLADDAFELAPPDIAGLYLFSRKRFELLAKEWVGTAPSTLITLDEK